VQQACQEGESSEMGATRTTGEKGTMLAGDISSEQPAGAEVLNAAILG
jgi:hypothetical protein